MLNKLEKIEEKLNEKIEALQVALTSLYFRLMPKIVFIWWKNFKLKVHSLTEKFKQKSISGYEKSKLVTQKVSHSVDKVSKYPFKEKIISSIEFLKRVLLKTPLRSQAHWITEKLKSSIHSVDAAMDKVGKGQLAVAALAITTITFGLYSVINSTQQIVQSEYPDRTPASIQEYAYKPSYKKFQKRTHKVLNVKIPVYRENVKQIRSVTVDFTVRTTTRFAKKYLEHYESQLKDHFFTTTEPILSSFTIEEEGKLVFKEKIQEELNAFLKARNVEGEVEEVGISFIIAN